MTGTTVAPDLVYRATASVPGKLILMGEHAVVYRRPALVAAAGLRLVARFSGPRPRGGPPGVRLDVPALGLAGEVPWSEIHAYARRTRTLWQTYAERPSTDGFAGVRGSDPAHVVKIALGEAAAFLGEGGGPPIDLAVGTDLPVGAGLGSSAAAAVALVAGYLALRDAPARTGDVERLALEVERRQHGLPSGVDSATVLHGGLLWAEPDPGGGLSFTRFHPRSPLLGRLRVFDTGTPPEATGTVVAAVRARYEAAPRPLEAILDRLAEAAWALRRELTALAGDAGRLREILTAGQRALEELGVVPPPVAELARRVEAAGGAAKISGAGSLTGPGAGSLLVFHHQPEQLDELAALRPLRRLEAPLGAPGLRVASGADGGAS